MGAVMTAMACGNLQTETGWLIAKFTRGSITAMEFRQRTTAATFRINAELGAYLAVHAALGGAV